MSSSLQKIQLLRRILLASMLLVPIFVLYGTNLVIMATLVALMAVASLVIEYTVINYFVYKTNKPEEAEAVYSNGFNYSIIMMMSGLMLILISPSDPNASHFFAFFVIGNFCYLFGIAGWMGLYCSRKRKNTYRPD